MVIEATAEGPDSYVDDLKNLEACKRVAVKNPFKPTADGRPLLPTCRNDIRESPRSEGAVAFLGESPAFGMRLHRPETP